MNDASGSNLGSVWPCVIGVKHILSEDGRLVRGEVFALHPSRSAPVAIVSYDPSTKDGYSIAHQLASDWCRQFLKHQHQLKAARDEVARILAERKGGYVGASE